MPEVLQLSHVTVRRGNKEILHDVSWEVHDGERWVILGPNGAGKTTVVQLASGRMFPTRGSVSILGDRLGAVDVAELRTRVGLASAALAERIPGTEPVLDVVLTAAYGMTGRWREEYDESDVARARELLAAFGVGHLAARKFATLSEGERKRAQVARALMSDPELLILDEPASGLDLGGREVLLGALADLAVDPHAPLLILVTHHVEEIPPGFTHAMLMRDGRVEAAGPLGGVMTSEHLSRAFGMDLEVEGREGRYTARARRA